MGPEAPDGPLNQYHGCLDMSGLEALMASKGLSMASGIYQGLLDISEPEALMTSMQLGGPDGVLYSYSYRAGGTDDLPGT